MPDPPSLPGRSGAAVATGERRPIWPQIATPLLGFCAARVMLSLLGAGFWIAGLVPLTADGVLRPYFGVTPVTQGLAGALLGVWQRFDVIHYIRIAAGGYSAPDLSAYFPLFPLLIRWIAAPLSDDFLLAAMLVSNGAAALALVAFYHLVKDEGGGAALGRRATLYMLFFPTAFFLLVPYTESLALLFSLLTFRLARQGRWWSAGIAGLAGALTRVHGVLVVPALLVEAAYQRKKGTRIRPAMVFAGFAPVGGFLGFVAWRASMGFPALSTVQRSYWHRVTTLPFRPIASTLGRLAANQASFLELMDLAVVVLMLALGVMVVKRLPLTYSAFFWVVMLFNLTQLRIPEPLSDQARYAFGLFPAFMVLGQLGSHPRANRLVTYSFFAGWIYLAGQFILWGWVG
jgi:hypothetical protein